MVTPPSSPSAADKTSAPALHEQRRSDSAPHATPEPTHKRSSSLGVLSSSSGDPKLLREDAVTSTPHTTKHHHSSSLSPSDDPFRTPQQSDSSPDNSLSTPSTAPHSAASASVELFLGPQPLSYIHLRKRILNAEEYNPSPLRSKNADADADVPPLITVASSTSNVIERPPLVTLVPSEKLEPDPNAPQLAKWRQEQLKKVKPIRPVAGARERPIPLLHGPLSLPYARNPSGVDATVADQSSYMSHVFGLRVVNSPDNKGTGPSPRVMSEPTRKSHSGGGYTSASSPQQLHPRYSDNANPFSPTAAKRRPMVVRDYNQVIGIKKDVIQEAPDSSQLKMSAYLAQAVDARAQIGLGKPIAPMPSPSDAKGRMRSDSYLPQFLGNYGIDNETTILTLVDPLTHQSYAVQIPKNSVVDPAIDLSSFEKIHTSTPYSGKADSSINWRNKQSRSNQGTPVRSLAAAHANMLASPSAKDPSASPQVLTLETLYEKFAHKKVPSKEELSNLPSPQSSLSKGSTPAAVLKALSVLNDNTSRKVNVPEVETASPSKASPAKKKRSASSKTRSAAPKTEPVSPSASPQKATPARRSKRTAKSVAA